jgi:hypothetical protein
LGAPSRGAARECVTSGDVEVAAARECVTSGDVEVAAAASPFNMGEGLAAGKTRVCTCSEKLAAVYVCVCAFSHMDSHTRTHMMATKGRDREKTCFSDVLVKESRRGCCEATLAHELSQRI